MSDDGFETAYTCPCPKCAQAAVGASYAGEASYGRLAAAASTGDYRIDALLFPDHDRWNTVAPVGMPVAVSYSFLTSANDRDDAFGFAALDATQKAGARTAFAAWEAVANIHFVEVSSGGDIAIGTNVQFDSAAYAYQPGSSFAYLGDIYLSNVISTNLTMSAGSYGLLTMVHEIGHAIGLKHPGSYNGSSNSGIPPYLPSGEDHINNTVMSYNDFGSPYPSAPQSYDALAVGYLYGTKSDTGISYSQSGDTLLTTGTSHGDTLIGINLNDRIVGGAGADSLYGLTGNDTIYGNIDNDLISGDTGNDMLYAGRGADTVVGGTGNDTIYGNIGDDAMTGDAGADLLYGGQGNDTISGGTGNDTLLGNLGDDSLISGSGVDRFVINSGNDTISDFSFSSGDRIQVASGTLISAANGSSGAVISFSNSTATVTLIGISSTSVSSSYFEFV